MNKKIRKLLSRLIVEAPERVFVVKRAVKVGGLSYGGNLFMETAKGFILWDEFDRRPVGVGGVIADLYNTNIWKVIEGLVAFKKITQEEADKFDTWMRKRDEKLKRQDKIRKVIEEARVLGLEVNDKASNSTHR